MSNLRGVDVASYQGLPGKWARAAGRIAWVAVKLTELESDGHRYVNPDATADWKYAARKKLGRIAYLYGHTSTPAHETVDFFLAELHRASRAAAWPRAVALHLPVVRRGGELQQPWQVPAVDERPVQPGWASPRAGSVA